jgi:hypothetical protein
MGVFNYLSHWSNIKPTMIQGGRVVGKSFIGSTLNPMNRGGSDFKAMDMGSNVLKRNENGRTITGLYAYFYRHMKMQKITRQIWSLPYSSRKRKKFYKCTRRTKTLRALQYI